MRSSRNRRPKTATKKGDEFSSTAATAAPARLVPSLMATRVMAVLPVPTMSAQAQPLRVLGSRDPMSGSTDASRSPPAIARTTATTVGVVSSSAALVAGYAAPARITTTVITIQTGRPWIVACRAAPRCVNPTAARYRDADDPRARRAARIDRVHGDAGTASVRPPAMAVPASARDSCWPP